MRAPAGVVEVRRRVVDIFSLFCSLSLSLDGSIRFQLRERPIDGRQRPSRASRDHVMAACEPLSTGLRYPGYRTRTLTHTHKRERERERDGRKRDEKNSMLPPVLPQRARDRWNTWRPSFSLGDLQKRAFFSSENVQNKPETTATATTPSTRCNRAPFSITNLTALDGPSLRPERKSKSGQGSKSGGNEHGPRIDRE